MKIKIGEEQVVAIGPRYEDTIWGVFQFPTLMKGEGKKVLLKFHNADDAWEELGRADIWCTTEDEGNTWTRVDESTIEDKGVLLPNGDRLAIAPRPSDIWDLTKIKAPMSLRTQTIPSDNLKRKSEDPQTLPYPRGIYWDIFKNMHGIYHVSELPDGLLDHVEEWKFIRKRAGEQESKEEWAQVHGWEHRPLHVNFSWNGREATYAIPNAYGDIKIGPDNRLWIACGYHGLNPANGAYTPYAHVLVFCSEDNGYNWSMQSFVRYVPDPDEYENAYMSEGYCEPALEFMPDGSMIMLLRTATVFKGDKEWSPSYITRSTDNGKSWSKPKRYDDIGVLPGMCRLGDVTMAIYGRPGIYVRATSDPAGMEWEKPVEIMTSNDRSGLMNTPPERPDFHQWAGSCCNCDIIALDETRAMIAYSDFYHLCEDGVRRKSIKTRIITIEK